MEGKTSDSKVTDSAKINQEQNLSLVNPNVIVSSGFVLPMTLNAGVTPKHDAKCEQFDDDDYRNDYRIGNNSSNSNSNSNSNSGGSSIAPDTAPFIPKTIDSVNKAGLLKLTSSFPKKDPNKNCRQIHFSDQVGGELEENVYCSNLHYSNNDVMKVTEPSTGCCTMS